MSEASTRAGESLVPESGYETASFRAVIEASPIPFALNDDAGNITYLNPEFVRTFGYTRDDIPTLVDWWPRAYPDERYRAEVATQWAERLAESQRAGVPFEPMEVIIHAADGSRHTVVAYARSLGASLVGTHLVVLYDVTRERGLADEQRLLQEQLTQAQRLESVGRLAGGIAHDFNNTLGVIVGRAEIALKSPSLDDDSRDHLAEILAAAQHSAELIRQLLAYAKKQPVSPQLIDPNESVEASMRMLELFVGEGARLRWTPNDDAWLVRIDPGQFDQVLTNLCSNARDAAAPGGEVTVGIENLSLEDGPLARQAGVEAGDYVVLVVADDGEGVAPEIAGRIFEPFFTTKPATHGHHGLGLSTVYGIARQNDGGVLLESTPGRGSVFKVLFPRARG